MKDHSLTSLSCLQPYNPGFDGFQSGYSDLSMMMSSSSITGCLGAGIDNSYHEQLSDGNMDYSSEFSHYSPVMYSPILSTSIEDLSLASPPPPLMEYHCGLPCDSSIKSQSLLTQPYERIMKDARKCASGARLGRQRNNITSNITSLEASRMSKKRKAIEQLIDSRQLEMQKPGRRSQKLSDKITALQEIVCPYGKTDTASVLHEACIYIRIIHQELRRLSISYFETMPLQLQPQLQDDAERQADLQSKGLCLVPISIMKSLTRENWGDQHHAASRAFSRRARNI